jgi:hypothetical protein
MYLCISAAFIEMTWLPVILKNLIHIALVLYLFAVMYLANLYQFLICAVTFSV